jgi:hypothetical protein
MMTLGDESKRAAVDAGDPLIHGRRAKVRDLQTVRKRRA